MAQKVGTTNRPLRVAIIGAGPSGFYAAGALLEQSDFSVSIDIFDRLLTPYGLVRSGVAPDHQKIKSVIRIYERTAKDPRVRFFGHVSYGTHISHESLRRYYDQVIYAVGAPSDRRLGIPGEELIGSDPATIFVGWYNGHPDYAHLHFDMTVENVAVIGNGNVAMDVARIYAKATTELATTDIADHALESLGRRQVKNIYVLGRRGPAQAAFTNPELRELGELEGVDVMVHPEELVLDAQSAAFVEQDKEATRNLRTLTEFAERGDTGKPIKIHMRFLVSPVEILGEQGRVSSLKIERNELYQTEEGTQRPRGTGEFERLPVEIVLRAVGYNGVALAGVPFDAKRGVIPNREGRVIDPDSRHPVSGEYVVGWAKRGPTGVIGTNKTDAAETVRHMLEDVPVIAPVDEEESDPAAAEAFIRKQQPDVVTFADWNVLNALEEAAGKARNRPRVKFVRIDEMMAKIQEHKAQE